MRDDAIKVMKKREKSKSVARKPTTAPRPKGRRPNTDNPAYWSGNSAAILQRLSQKMKG
jgi:hypothetical protein